MDYDKFTREQVLFITFIGICGNMSHTFTWSYYLAERSGWVVFGIGILLQIPFVMGILYKKYSTNILLLIALLIFLPSAWLNSSNTAYFLSIFTTSFIVLPFAIIVMMLACLGIRIIKKGLVVTKIEKNKNFVNHIKFNVFVYRMLGLC